jgi:hypothetical protein
MPRELPIPPMAAEDEASFELIRVWASRNKQHVTIVPNFTGGAANFGGMLADLARHGARLYSQREGIEIRAALEIILSRMSKELRRQGNNLEGHIGYDA